MHALISWIVLADGWSRRLLAVCAGAIGALALAPVDFAPAMIVPMCVAVFLIDGSSRGESPGRLAQLLKPRSCLAAAGAGWWWGLGYFLAGFWWLGAAFLVEPDKDAWAMPFGVLGVPVMLAVFPALGFALARVLWSSGRTRVLALAAGLGLSEWLRGHVFTGFPWNNYGMAFGDSSILSQAASVFGNPGLTVLVIAVCASPATLADPARPGRGPTFRVVPAALAVLAVLSLVAFGLHRIPSGPLAMVQGVKLRIVQPNVPQDARFSYANKDKILADYLELSDRATSPDHAGLNDVTHLIWPESAFPFILARDADALQTIGNALPLGTVLVTGAARMAPSGDSGNPLYFNAIQVVAPGGAILDSYDKVHLVPFGEYLPLDSVLRRTGLTHFVHVPGGFTPGAQRRLLDVPGLPPAVPLICYEAIFPDEIWPPGNGSARAGLLLNVTNDGWFGRTAGPYQHFAQARLRAIETGLPLVRAANTGISAVVDPYGRVVASLPLGARSVLDSRLPLKLKVTIYQSIGWAIEPGVYFVLAMLSIAASRPRQST